MTIRKLIVVAAALAAVSVAACKPKDQAAASNQPASAAVPTSDATQANATAKADAAAAQQANTAATQPGANMDQGGGMASDTDAKPTAKPDAKKK